MKKETLRVVTGTCSPHDINEVIEHYQKLKDSGLSPIRVDFDECDSYGSEYVFYGFREETDEEFQDRVEKEKRLKEKERRKQEQREKTTYERLKKKYEKT